MDVNSVENLSRTFVLYSSYIIIVVGNIGCIFNFLTFTSKKLRRNSCGYYFLLSSIFDFITINFGIFTKLANDIYGSNLKDTNIVWCKSRIYLTWVLPSIATGYLLLASIDRYLSTSLNVRCRSFSQIKVAYRMTCVPILIYSVTAIHQLILFDIRSRCVPVNGAYAYFLSVYSIVWTSFIPQLTMLIFGLLTYIRIKRSRERLTQRVDSNMIRLTIIQVLASSILLSIRSIYYAYTSFSRDVPKDEYRLAVEELFLDITSFIFYVNSSKNFFLNTLSSKLFRRIFLKRLIRFYQQIFCCKTHQP